MLSFSDIELLRKTFRLIVATNKTVQEIKEIVQTMSAGATQFQSDVTQLLTDVNTEIGAIDNNITEQSVLIEDINSEIADLKNANPGIDFTDLDAAVKAADANVTATSTSIQTALTAAQNADAAVKAAVTAANISPTNPATGAPNSVAPGT